MQQAIHFQLRQVSFKIGRWEKRGGEKHYVNVDCNAISQTS